MQFRLGGHRCMRCALALAVRRVFVAPAVGRMHRTAVGFKYRFVQKLVVSHGISFVSFFREAVNRYSSASGLLRGGGSGRLTSLATAWKRETAQAIQRDSELVTL